jgi:hypothetical protein
VSADQAKPDDVIELTPDEMMRLVVVGLIETKRLAQTKMLVSMHCVFDPAGKVMVSATLTVKYPGLRVVKNEDG